MLQLKREYVFCVFAILVSSVVSSQTNVSEFCQKNQVRLLKEYFAFLTIPNVATDKENILKNAAWISEALKARGLNPELLNATTPNTPPAVYAEWNQPGAKRTLLFYAHYDGQPVTPKDWHVTDPFHPMLRFPDGTRVDTVPEDSPINPETRIYARSASDDKAGVFGLLTAMEAIRANKLSPSSNLKFLFEGEEEAGSPHLNEIIAANQTKLNADVWIMCDGPTHQSGRKQAVFGVRGDVNVDLVVYGARRPLHSGHYGNWAPNPAMRLSKLLATMMDDNGYVTIAGWYDDVQPLTESEKRALSEVPPVEVELQKELGIAKPDGAGASLMDLLQKPSLNINGMSSADIGSTARNVIPTTATAVLDLRLVLGNDVQRQIQKLIEHIKKHGYFVIDHEPTDTERQEHALIARVNARPGGYNAQRTSMDLPISKFVIQAMQSTTDQPIIKLPTLGGSLPLSIIVKETGIPTITIPVVNYDNNQHAEDENLRLQNLWDGIETYVALMTSQ